MPDLEFVAKVGSSVLRILEQVISSDLDLNGGGGGAVFSSTLTLATLHCQKVRATSPTPLPNIFTITVETMNNFGVIEVAGPKTTRAPGWAYVPDSGPTPAQPLQPTNRKRAARNQGGLSSSDVSARQDAKIRKDLEALDRDTNKDVNIPIPPKSGSSRGLLRAPLSSSSPNLTSFPPSSPEQTHRQRPQDPPVPKDVCQPPRRLPSPAGPRRNEPGCRRRPQPRQRPTPQALRRPNTGAQLPRPSAPGQHPRRQQTFRRGSQARRRKRSQRSRQSHPPKTSTAPLPLRRDAHPRRRPLHNNSRRRNDRRPGPGP